MREKKRCVILTSDKSTIKPLVDQIIDFDSTPHTQSGWELRASDQIKSRLTGKWRFNPEAIEKYLSKEQKKGGIIIGNNLKDELDGVPVVGAQLLDFCLANPHLIPKEWKRKAACFWGTIYRTSSGRPCVQSLVWDQYGRRWGSSYRPLCYDFDYYHPALLISQP